MTSFSIVECTEQGEIMEHLLDTSNPLYIPLGTETSYIKASKTEQKSVVAVAKQIRDHTDPAQTPDTNANIKIDVQNATFFYGSKQALFDVTLPILEKQ